MTDLQFSGIHLIWSTDQWSLAAYRDPSGSGSGIRTSARGCGSKSSLWRLEHTNPPRSQPTRSEGKDKGDHKSLTSETWQNDVAVRTSKLHYALVDGTVQVFVVVPGQWEAECSWCPNGHHPPASAENCPEVSIKTRSRKRETRSRGRGVVRQIFYKSFAGDPARTSAREQSPTQNNSVLHC